MGGIGSGRRGGLGRETVESCRTLDVNHLKRSGCLRPGWCGEVHWKRNGRRIGLVGVRTERDRLHLSYCIKAAGGDWQQVAETISIVRIPCRFGGVRPYFICPGVSKRGACRRGVIKLHGAGRYFLCRQCYRLPYSSQSEGPWNRALRRAEKIRHRLGGEPGVLAPFPNKPKGMWQKTYQRLRRQALEAEKLANLFMAYRAEWVITSKGNADRR